jgi:hypothetical protein
MDRIPIGRLALFIAAGFVIGYGATLGVDSAGANPLLASLVIAAGAAAVGVWLRRWEFLNVIVESAIYAYSGYIGLALVRATPLHQHLAQNLDVGRAIDLTPLILLAGAGFTAVLVFAVAMPAWMIAGRLSEPKAEDPENFWSFVESRIESGTNIESR